MIQPKKNQKVLKKKEMARAKEKKKEKENIQLKKSLIMINSICRKIVIGVKPIAMLQAVKIQIANGAMKWEHALIINGIGKRKNTLHGIA